MTALRAYPANRIGADGYPAEWHRTIKHAVRDAVGHRCVRCGHPYRTRFADDAHGDGELVAVKATVAHSRAEWSPCDTACKHTGHIRHQLNDGTWVEHRDLSPYLFARNDIPVEAAWRVLTVHHLTGDKADCRWWNLAALCQRCHLTIQGKVRMAQVWPHEHSEWFKPYAAGYYAWVYLREELSREQVEGRLDELLALERTAA